MSDSNGPFCFKCHNLHQLVTSKQTWVRIWCDKLYTAGTAPTTDTSMYVGEVKRGYKKAQHFF